MYSIVIENVSLSDYISEKVLNPLMYESIPIYYGAKNFDSYLPNQCIHLSGEIDNDFELIESICKNPENYKKKIDRYEVENKFNLIEHLINLF